ncbi:MAG: GIY-YIG nuclease family protein [Candidatus Eremiobacteraeota bacterium]|nr:GIY-YIG nuclease family protein [Candidatus Eremiobacteraeota bacterium]MBV9972157.1 GIY-YIG nuclease family protein [Candidatus Eremiobacteraeota bacterium]
MLRCFDGTYYVGITNDLDRRIWEHNYGIDETCYTFLRRPLLCVWSEMFHHVLDAIQCEKKLKRWSHNKKSALARGDWKMISALSKGRDNRCPSTSSG